MYNVYVLKSKNYPKTYVGITDDIERRLSQHNAGNHLYTKRYMPWVIIYEEEYKNRDEARIREKYLKSAVGRKYLRKKIFEN